MPARMVPRVANGKKERRKASTVQVQHLEGRLLTRQQALARVQEEAEKDGFNVAAKHKRSTATYWEFGACCKQSAECPRRWTARYYFKAAEHEAKSFAISAFGEHVHEEGERNTASIWQPAARRIAERYARETDAPTNPGLYRTLMAKLQTSAEKAALPNAHQRRQWLYR